MVGIMETTEVAVNLTAYTQVNTGLGPITIEPNERELRVSISAIQPSATTTAYHRISAKDRIKFESPGANTWVLGLAQIPPEGNKYEQTARVTEEKQAVSGSGELVTDAYGIQKVSLPISLLHGLFTFSIPLSTWLMFEDGVEVSTSTDITSASGAAQLLTTVTNTVLILESRECPRYQPNRGHLFSCSAWMPDKANDGVRDFGLFTLENGVFFRLKSDGLLYAVLLSGGVETQEDIIDTSGLTSFDVEKGNIYDIQYQWRGVGVYHFYIADGSTGLSVLVHTINSLNMQQVLTTENPASPVRFRATRTTEDVRLNIGCADITSENGLTDREVYNSASALAVTISTDTPVIVVRQPLQINSTTNTRTMTLARVSCTSSKKGTFKVWTTRDPTAITGATYKAMGAGSFIETDSTDEDATAVRATSVNLAKLNLVTSIPVETLTTRSVDNPYRDRIEFPLVRGDYLIVTGTAATASAECTVEWGEQV
jgi:hypothetical protein